MVDWLKQSKTRARGRHAKKRTAGWENWRELVWPSMGARAFGRWALLQLVRSGNNPHVVALGFAIGMGINFTPWIGFHVLVAWALCWLFKAGYLAALLGTLVGNALTLPFMWGLSLEVGRKLVKFRPGLSPDDIEKLTFERLWYHFDRIFWDLIWPMSVGGVVVGIVVGAVTYALVWYAVSTYHDAKGRRILERKLAREMARGMKEAERA